MPAAEDQGITVGEITRSLAFRHAGSLAFRHAGSLEARIPD